MKQSSYWLENLILTIVGLGCCQFWNQSWGLGGWIWTGPHPRFWRVGTSAGAVTPVAPTKCAKRGRLSIEFQMAANPWDCHSRSFERSHSHPFYLPSRKSASSKEYENHPGLILTSSACPFPGHACCSLLSLYPAKDSGAKQPTLLQ